VTSFQPAIALLAHPRFLNAHDCDCSLRYGATAVAGIGLLLLGVLGGVVTALFYVLCFALASLGGVAVALPLLTLLIYWARNIPIARKLADKILVTLSAKSQDAALDAFTTEKNPRKDPSLDPKVIWKRVEVDIKLAGFFIVCSTADILSDAVYAGQLASHTQL